MSTNSTSSTGTSSTGTSPLYQYAVVAAGFLFASMFVMVFLRSRLERRRRPFAGNWAAGIPDVDILKKPPLFDAYLADPPGISPDATTRSWEWDEIMPLSVWPLGAVNASPPTKGASPSPPSDPDPSRVLVSVMILMPFSFPSSEQSDDDEPLLPHLEIGLSAADVQPRGGDERRTKAVP